VYPYGRRPQGESGRDLTVDIMRKGEPTAEFDLAAARERVKAGLLSLPWAGLKLSRGEPAIPTRIISPASH
jgi:nicotinate phosphoribosyltransferase